MFVVVEVHTTNRRLCGDDLVAGIAAGPGHRGARVHALFLDGCSDLHRWLAIIADEVR